MTSDRWTGAAFAALLIVIVTISLGAMPQPPATGADSPAIETAPAPADTFPSVRTLPAGFDSLTEATLETALDYLAIDRADLGFEKRYVEDDTFRLAVIDLLLEDPLAVPAWQSQVIRTVRERRDDPMGLIDWMRSVLEAGSRDLAGPGARVAPSSSRPPESLSTGSVSPGSAESAPAVRWPASAIESNARSAATNDDSATSDRMNSEPADPGKTVAPADDGTDKVAAPNSARFFSDAAAAFVASTRDAEQLLDLAYRSIEPAEREHLLAVAPAFFGEAEHPEDRLRKGMLHFEVGATIDTTFAMTDKRVLDAAARLDRRSLHLAARRFLAGILDLANTLPPPLAGADPTVDSPEVRSLTERIEGDVIAARSSPWGWILWGGAGTNRYPPDVLAQCAVIIDAGGNDFYEGRAASAVGGLIRPFSAVVDLGGDDVYRAEGRPFALAGAVLGIAVLVDTEGDDIYRGDDGSLGAGFFGVGLLHDGSGEDLLDGRSFTQGAGYCGIGYLNSGASPHAPLGIELQPDRAFALGMIGVPGTGAVPVRDDENDTYGAGRYAQGFAGTFGLGILSDVSGNDVYRAGGHRLHAPLLPHDFQSLAQGFSIGSRPRAAGGIGLLLDEEGNDFYDAEVYAQGTSYWYSSGTLFDGGGNDRYLATQYAQGAGVHLSVGSLWDRGGDDQYVSKHGVVQGTAHDLSVAVFWDESGNDSYVVTDGQGISLNNAVAVFVDGQGDDIYGTGRDGQGSAGYRRGFSGAAIFLDLEGKDAYPANRLPLDGASWSNSDFAIGIDLDRDTKLPDEEIPEIVLTPADSARAVTELFATASLWEVGSAREKVRRARKALIAKGTEAVRYATGAIGTPALYEHGEPLASDNGLVYRTLEALAGAYPDSFVAQIFPRLHDPNVQVQRNVISLLGDLKRRDARTALEEMLRDDAEEKHWVRILEALGKIGDLEAAPALRPFLDDRDERRRIQATAGLKALRDTTSVSDLVDLLHDSEMSVRSAALSAVVAFGGVSVPPLLKRLPGSEPAERLPITQGLAKVLPALADSSARELRTQVRDALFLVLEDSGEATDAACRAVAVAALWQLDDESARTRVEELITNETDPLVLRPYRRALERK